MLAHTHSHAMLPKRLVVLGGRGFVGSAIVAQAKQRGMETLALSSSDIDLTAAGSEEKLARILVPSDTVIFCAAIDTGNNASGEESIRNMRMAQCVASAAKKRPFAHLIYISSDSVYSYENALISEATPAAPVTLYGAMHRAREILLSKDAAVPMAILRPTAIYGASDSHGAYGPNRFIKQARQEGKITLFGGGEEMRDHVYVQDAAACIIEVACMQSVGILNIASGCSLSFYSLAQRIAHHTGADIEMLPRRQPVTHRHFDITKRMKAFPFFIPTDMDHGIIDILEHVTKNVA